MKNTLFKKNQITSHFARSFLKLDQVQGTYVGMKGNEKTFNHFIISKADAVCLTMYDKATDEFIFVKQFRTGAAMHLLETDPWILEPVAGHIDLHEDATKAAQREGEEETDLLIDVNDIVFLSRGYTSAGCLNEMHHHYFVYVDSTQIDFERSHGIDNEDIEIVAIKREDTLKMIDSCEIRTCSAILGVSMAIVKGLVPSK